MHPSRFKSRLFTTAAFGNGFAFELGLSPLGIAISGLEPFTPTLSVELSSLLLGVLTLATILDILVGLGNMWLEWGGWVGAFAWITAFVGGVSLVYAPPVAVILGVTAVLFEEFTPTGMHQY
jgi:hypothetical protein